MRTSRPIVEPLAHLGALLARDRLELGLVVGAQTARRSGIAARSCAGQPSGTRPAAQHRSPAQPSRSRQLPRRAARALGAAVAVGEQPRRRREAVGEQRRPNSGECTSMSGSTPTTDRACSATSSAAAGRCRAATARSQAGGGTAALGMLATNASMPRRGRRRRRGRAYADRGEGRQRHAAAVHRIRAARDDEQVHPAPAELVDQLAQLGRHDAELGIVPQPRLQRRAGDARLAGIDLPGMEIEHRRPALDAG